MEVKEIKYYILDSKNNFISYNYGTEVLFSYSSATDVDYCFKDLIRAKDCCFNLEQEWKDGEIGKHNVEFPLRPVKVSLYYVVEEVK